MPTQQFKMNDEDNMKISFYTFGCTVNNYETQKMRDLFIENGDEVVEDGMADVFIINSCAITSSVEKGAVQLMSRLKKKNPDAMIVLMGCFGESLKKNGKVEIPSADLVMDNKKFDIVEQVHKYRKEQSSNPKANKVSSPVATSKRALLEVQKGCDNGCTYCIVPYVRGRSVSKPFKEYTEELDAFIAQGYEEIVFAGLNLGFYNDGEHTLLDVLKYANAHDGVKSIRLSSLEPMNVGEGFIEALPSITKLNPHLHISLQSGCERTLEMMNRKYTFEEYLAMITKIRELIPNIAITTDIIVGFPGETEADFQESIQNIVKCNFSDIHIFKYSKRGQTPAATMEHQVTEHQKIKRSLLLKGVKMQTRYQYMRQFIGENEDVILLRRVSENLIEGVTSHNFPVFIESSAPIELGLYNAKITGINTEQTSFLGELV